MDVMSVSNSANLPISLDELREAGSRASKRGLELVVSSVSEKPASAHLKTHSGDVVIYVFTVVCRDGRVKTVFSRENNAFDDVAVLSKEFDKEKSFASAIRILIGDSDPRFRSKPRVESFVRKVGVSEVAKALSPVFSDFMFAVHHAFNCAIGRDVTEKIYQLRNQIRLLMPDLSEAEIVRIYREEMVSYISKL